jgi:hypothetical protein
VFGLQKLGCKPKKTSEESPQEVPEEALALINAIAVKIAKSPSVELNHIGVPNVVFGLQVMDCQYPEVRKLIEAIAEKLENTPDVELSVLGGTNIVYGLKTMDCQYPEVRRLIAAVTNKMTASPRTQLDVRGISQVILGLQKMDCQYAEVLALIEAIIPKIKSVSSVTMSDQGIANAVYGLQTMDCQYPVVRKLIKLIVTKISAPELGRVTLNALGIANAVYGLQTMDCGHAEARELISVVTEKIKKSPRVNFENEHLGRMLSGLGFVVDRQKVDCISEKMSEKIPKEILELIDAVAEKISKSSPVDLRNKHLSAVVHSFKTMDCQYPEVLRLIDAIAAKLENSSHMKLEARTIGSLVNGFQTMDCQHPKVHRLIAAVAQKIDHSKKTLLDAQGLGNLMFGLQTMDCQYPEVRNLINILAENIENSIHVVLPEIGISDVVFGLQTMDCQYPEVRRLIAAVSQKISIPELKEIKLSAQQIANMVYGLQTMDCQHPEVCALIDAVAEKIENSTDEALESKHISNMLGLQTMSGDQESARHLIRAITLKILHSSAQLDAQGISCVVYGLQKMNCQHEDVRALIDAVAEKIENSPTENFTPQGMANVVYGLQTLDCQHEQVRHLVKVVAEKIKKARSVALTEQGMADIAYGLQTMDCQHEEVRALIDAVAEKIENSPTENFTPQGMANVVYGLQTLDCQHEQVRHLVKVVAEKIKKARSVALTEQGMANIVYGLKSMKSNHFEVCDLVEAVAETIKLSPNVALNSQAFGNILYGLKGMNPDNNKVVCELIKAITHKISNSLNAKSSIMSARHCAAALYGLQRMSSSSKEVQDLLDVITPKIKTSSGEWSAQGIAMALFGLQKMSCATKEVKILLDVITPKIKDSSATWHTQGIGMALLGLQNMSIDSEEVKVLLAIILEKIKAVPESSTQPISDVGFYGMGLYGLRRMPKENAVVAEISNILQQRIKNLSSSSLLNDEPLSEPGALPENSEEPSEKHFFQTILVPELREFLVELPMSCPKFKEYFCHFLSEKTTVYYGGRFEEEILQVPVFQQRLVLAPKVVPVMPAALSENNSNMNVSNNEKTLDLSSNISDQTLDNGNCAFNAVGLFLSDQLSQHPHTPWHDEVLAKLHSTLNTTVSVKDIPAKLASLSREEKQTFFSPALRQSVINYMRCYADYYEHQYWLRLDVMLQYCLENGRLNAKNIPDADSFLVHPFIKKMFERLLNNAFATEEDLRRHLAAWWEETGFVQYLNAIEQEAHGTGDIARWGGATELDILGKVFNFRMRIQSEQRGGEYIGKEAYVPRNLSEDTQKIFRDMGCQSRDGDAEGNRKLSLDYTMKLRAYRHFPEYFRELREKFIAYIQKNPNIQNYWVFNNCFDWNGWNEMSASRKEEWHFLLKERGICTEKDTFWKNEQGKFDIPRTCQALEAKVSQKDWSILQSVAEAHEKLPICSLRLDNGHWSYVTKRTQDSLPKVAATKSARFHSPQPSKRSAGVVVTDATEDEHEHSRMRR